MKRVEERTAELAAAKEMADLAQRIAKIDMSHELRTPLNAILGFSGMMARDRQITTDQKEKLFIINRSGEHLLAMINDVLDFSKIEAGRLELEPEAFDLPQMLEDIGHMFMAQATDAGLRFELELDPALARYIKADVGRLRQILINLLGNAVKFTREDDFSLRVRTVSVAGDPGMLALQFEVEDSGPGISPEQQTQIFEPFVQAKQVQAASKGTGLGLSITRSFVELMGGEISVESRLSEGALFCVDLPVMLAEASTLRGVEATKQKVVGLESGQPK